MSSESPRRFVAPACPPAQRPTRRLVTIPRRTAVLCLLIALMPATATAQVSYEVHGGVTSYSYRVDGATEDPESRTGFAVGAAALVDLTTSIRISAGFEYARRGGNLRSGFGFDPGGTAFSRWWFEQDYVAVPLLAELRTSIGAAAPFVSLGPEVAFEVSCSVDEEIFSLDQFGRIVGKETRGGMECGDDTASVQVGLRAGGGVEFPVSGSIRLVLRAHYLVGLTDALDGSERGNAKLQSIGVSAGIAF